MRTMIVLVSLLALTPPAFAELYVRYDSSTKEIKHQSTVPFTTPAKDGESDAVLDSAPADARVHKMNASLDGFEEDKAKKDAQKAKDDEARDMKDSVEDKLKALGFTPKEAAFLLK